MFDTNRKYKIHWELTDRCNLKCPMCPRTDALNRCRPVQEIQKTQFLLDDVKKHLPDRFLKRVKRIDFCGNFGEPCLASDFYEICEYLMATHGIQVMVSTNGSIRPPGWWKKLGQLFAGTDSWLEFHVDGLRQTNHLYRIGADWDKIMANAEAFISGGARTDWHYILFKHNQHQVDEACDLARRMGFNKFVATGTSRFAQGGIYRYMHPDGSWRKIEQATISVYNGMKKTATSDPLRTPSTESRGNPIAGDTRCKSLKQNRFYIDATGDIAPCCWVFSRDVQRPGDMLRSIFAAGRNIDEFNLRNRPVEDILGDELFTEIFPDQWKEDRLATCRKKCGWQPRMLKRKVNL